MGILMLRALKKLWPSIFLLGALVFIGQYFYHQMAAVHTPMHFSISYLLIGVSMHLIYWMLNTLCWQATIAWCANKKIGLLQSFSHFAMATLGKYFPGKIWGMVARASTLVQQGVTPQQSVYATLNEQYLILYASCIVSAMLLCTIEPSRYTFFLVIVAVLSLSLIVPLQKFAFRFVPRLIRVTWAQGAEETIPLGLNKMIILLVVYGAIWILLGLIFCCVYYSLFPAKPSLPMILRLVLANTVGITIGFFAVFSPGGLGVREAVTSSLLASQLNLEDAVVLSLMFRLWIVASELISGLTLLVPQKILAPRGNS